MHQAHRAVCKLTDASPHKLRAARAPHKIPVQALSKRGMKRPALKIAWQAELGEVAPVKHKHDLLKRAPVWILQDVHQLPCLGGYCILQLTQATGSTLDGSTTWTLS